MAASATGVSERAIRDWFDQQLITETGLRGQVLRQPDSSAGLDNGTIRQLVDGHLVRAEERRGATWFELASDRLISPIRTDNAAWRDTRLTILQRQAMLWMIQGRPYELLLTGELLAEAEQWAAAHQAELTADEREYLTVSQRMRRASLRRDRLVIISVVLVFLVIGLAVALALLLIGR
jgi:hypothetical protein